MPAVPLDHVALYDRLMAQALATASEVPRLSPQDFTSQYLQHTGLRGAVLVPAAGPGSAGSSAHDAGRFSSFAGIAADDTRFRSVDSLLQLVGPEKEVSACGLPGLAARLSCFAAGRVSAPVFPYPACLCHGAR